MKDRLHRVSIDEDAMLERAATAASRRFPGARLTDLRRFDGGLSSLTYAVHLDHDGGDADIVLKVAPPGLPPVRNRDVLRQTRVLDALAGRVPVPEVLFTDPGAPPEVPPLFGMTRAAGESYEPGIDVTPRPPAPQTAAARFRGAARVLGRLHAPSPRDLGLDDEPVTSPTDECERWARLLATIDVDIAPGHDDLLARLLDRVPAPAPARVLHGDYRLGNMLAVDDTLSAVIDWEIWSVGDPRFDLAWLLMHLAPVQAFHRERPAADRAASSRLPTPTVLVADYSDAGGRDGSDLGWFSAACLYKGAATVAAIWKRERRRPEPDPKAVIAAERLGDLLVAGHAALDR